MTDVPFITDDARRLIGTVIEREQSMPVSAHHVRQYLVGTNDRNPAYLPSASGEGSVAPPLFLLAALRQLVYRDELAEDGQHHALSVGGITGRTIEGGTDFTLHAPVYVGDVLQMERTLVSLDEKVGRSGAMVVMVTRSRSSRTNTARSLPSSTTRSSSGDHVTAAARPVSPALAEPDSALPELVEHVDIVTNFMFGVALFTAHRLHYDQVGAEQDGFAAPVIPGTLMSAYIARLLVDWTGDPTCLRRLTNRNVATEVVGHDIRVSGTVTGVEVVPGDAGGERRLLSCALTVDSDGRVLVESTAVVEVAVSIR